MADDDGIDFARSRAVLVGNSRYDNLTSFQAADNSLTRMRGLLTGVGGWPDDERIVAQFREKSSGDPVRRDVAQLIHEAEDVLLVYYVGHGQLIDSGDDLALALRDTSVDPVMRRSTSLCLSDLQKEIAAARIRCRVRILILDCCYAGVAVQNTQGLAELTDQINQVARPERAEGAFTLTASRYNESARYDPDANGLTYFMKYFAEIVEGGIDNRERWLSGAAIYNELRARFDRLHDPRVPVPPTPDSASTGSAGAFHLFPNALAHAPVDSVLVTSTVRQVNIVPTRRWAAEDRPFLRNAANPLLTPFDWPPLPHRAHAVSDPGATRFGDETLLLCQVTDRRGLTQLTVARSPDGVSLWRVDAKPLIADDPSDSAALWGSLDPRITWVAELGAYVIAYALRGPGETRVALALTEDFQSVERLGVTFQPIARHACLLPRRVNGDFILFYQLKGSGIWLSRSHDLRQWRTQERVMAAREGALWDAMSLAVGPPPIETEAGWLGVYGGTDERRVTRCGLVLFGLEDPAKVLRRLPFWTLGPSADYEIFGELPRSVVPSGLLHDEETGQLHLYYGASGMVIGMASAALSEVLDLLLEHG